MFDPLHYLATLGVKPANLDQTDVYRDWLFDSVLLIGSFRLIICFSRHSPFLTRYCRALHPTCAAISAYLTRGCRHRSRRISSYCSGRNTFLLFRLGILPDAAAAIAAAGRAWS